MYVIICTCVSIHASTHTYACTRIHVHVRTFFEMAKRVEVVIVKESQGKREERTAFFSVNLDTMMSMIIQSNQTDVHVHFKTSHTMNNIHNTTFRQ